MNKTKKTVLYLVLAAVIAGCVWTGFSYYRRARSYEGEITATVEKEIIIQRDKNGTPHVKAGSIKDACFAVGFLHGQDRLALIEYFRAAAKGTLSELIGERGLEIDRIMRTMGFSARAEELVKKLKSPYMDYLDAYTYGINVAKQNFGEDTGSSAEIPQSAWTMKDVLSILLMMEWSDVLLNDRELLFPLPDSLNKSILKDLIPEEYLYYYTLEESKNVDRLKNIRKTVAGYIGPFSDGLAFYLSGRRIRDGKPIIGLNLNSNLNQYPKWYPVYMIIGNKKMACITASGLPFFYFGSSDTIAFAGFSMKIDTQDFCNETIKKIDDQKYYLGNGRWNKLSVAEEKIYTDQERSEENAKKIYVYRKQGGEILSSIPDESGDSHVSLKSISPDEHYIASLFDIPFAGSLQEAAALLRNKTSGPRVYLFTDYDSAVIAHSGMVPVREIGGKVFKNNPDTAWKSVTDISSLGVLTENTTMIIGDQYFAIPKNIEGLITRRDGNRYSRLEFLMGNERLNDRKAVEEILLDSHSPVAEKFTPLFMSILETVSITSSRLSRIYFNQWDSSIKADSVPSSIFINLLADTIRLTISDDLEDYHDELMENYDLIIDKFYTLLSENKSFIFDDAKTKTEIEDRDSLFRRAFLKTLRHLNERYGPIMDEWKWREADSTPYRMPLYNEGLFEKTWDDKKSKGDVRAINMGTINSVNMPGADNILSLSGIYHGSLLYLSQSFSCPMDPDSEYYKNNEKIKKYTCLNRERGVETLKIIPQSRKSEK